MTGTVAILLMRIKQLSVNEQILHGLLIGTIVIVGITIGVWLYQKDKGDK